MILRITAGVSSGSSVSFRLCTGSWWRYGWCYLMLHVSDQIPQSHRRVFLDVNDVWKCFSVFCSVFHHLRKCSFPRLANCRSNPSTKNSSTNPKLSSTRFYRWIRFDVLCVLRCPSVIHVHTCFFFSGQWFWDDVSRSRVCVCVSSIESVDGWAHVSEWSSVRLSEPVSRTSEGHRHPEEILLLSRIIPGETAGRFLLASRGTNTHTNTSWHSWSDCRF